MRDDTDGIAHMTPRFALWALLGIVLGLIVWAFTFTSEAHCKEPQIAESWSANTFKDYGPRGTFPPQTYTLEPIPLPEAFADQAARDHLNALLLWSLQRQHQRDEMEARHKRGIVHPDEM